MSDMHSPLFLTSVALPVQPATFPAPEVHVLHLNALPKQMAVAPRAFECEYCYHARQPVSARTERSIAVAPTPQDKFPVQVTELALWQFAELSPRASHKVDKNVRNSAVIASGPRTAASRSDTETKSETAIHCLVNQESIGDIAFASCPAIDSA
jgi:hypothetical protein